MLKIENLSKTFRTEEIETIALNNVSMEVKEGEFVAIMGPSGCGKSTLMKRLAIKAEQKGEPIQRIHCASDPDSLDGVVFLGQRAAIVDATAPHVVEPDAPGADEVVVSLYHTIDAEKLHLHTEEVKALFARNAILRSRAARYVASAGSLLLDSRRAVPLGSAAMETLTVIAYNQPVSRAFIEQVRGVDSSSSVSGLLEKGLIEEAGRLDLPGRPVSFRTTDTFLRVFGLSSLADLPPVHSDAPADDPTESEG
mgnify:CR=1 FL=1